MKFQFIGFVGTYSKCCLCDKDSIASWFGIQVGDHSVVGNSFCEEHLKVCIEEQHDDPAMHLAAQVVFVRAEPVTPPDGHVP